MSWLIDTIQSAGLAEEVQEIPDVRWSFKWTGLLYGLRRTLNKGLAFGMLIHLYQIVAIAVLLITGFKLPHSIEFGLGIAVGLLLLAVALYHPLLAAFFARDYIKGPRSLELWTWYLAGVSAGFPLGFLVITTFAILAEFFTVEFLASNPEILNSILTNMYRILPPESQQILYRMALNLMQKAKTNTLDALIDLGITGGVAVVSAGLLYKVPQWFLMRKVRKAQGIKAKFGPGQQRPFN